jgi:hypothetical protein
MGTDLATAALLLSLRDRRIATTVTAVSKVSTMTSTLRSLDAHLPRISAPEHWLDNRRPDRAVTGGDRHQTLG